MDVLNFNNKLVSNNYKSWLYDYSENKKTYPLIIELDPTSSCMFSCPECINADITNSKRAFSTQQLKSLINDFSKVGVKGIIFIGGGEPLLHNGIGQAFNLCYEKGIKIGITTNGLLIDKYASEIAEFADWTRVSVDASNSQSFLRVRPNKFKDSFDKIIDNMYQLSKIKNGLLGYSFLLVEQKDFSNVNEIYDAAKLAREIGCDYFEFKPMVDIKHFLFKYSSEFLMNLERQMEKVVNLQTPNFKIVSPKSVFKYSQENLEQPKEYKECPIAKLRTLVTPYGIFPCPYKRGNEKFNMGEINESFINTWESKSTQDILRSLDPSKDCTFNCIRNELNMFLLSVKDNPLLLDKISFSDNNDVFV